ncbi:Tetratricopeptide repeat protein [compost metagenome]
MLDRFGDNPSLFYYVALCYRKLENYEKAIYYLNESIAIDSSIVETINEMGINYASLEDFENAIKYFRKAFEATRDIEICTNLIMCYLNSGDLKQARLHLEIAEKINKDDEIVKEIKEYMKRFN